MPSGFPQPCDSLRLLLSLLFLRFVFSGVKAARKIPKFGFDEKCTDQLTRIPISEFPPSSVLSRCIAVSPIGREGNSLWSCGNGTFKCICIGNTETEIAVNRSHSAIFSSTPLSLPLSLSLFSAPFCLIKISVPLRVTRRKLSTMMFPVHAEVAVSTMMLEGDSFYWRLNLLRYIDSRFFADSFYSQATEIYVLSLDEANSSDNVKNVSNY